MTARIARFRTRTRIHMVSQDSNAEVTINRDTGVVSVRALRHKESYELPLADVASYVANRVIRGAVAETKRKGR